MTAVDPRDAGRTTPSRLVFPVLDTMRAVGALAVLATHTAFWAGDYTGNGIWGTALARLDVGVAIFFVLSGFLLSRPYIARRLAGSSRPHTGRYLWKRALRVIPVYLVVATSALLLLPGNEDAGLQTWLQTLTLTNIYLTTGLPDGLTQMWSLATEVAFYVALPGLMALGLGGAHVRRRLMTLLVLMVVVTAVWLLQIAPQLTGSRLVMQWLPSYLSWFAVGIALAWVHTDWERGRAADSAWQSWLVLLGRSPGVCWSMALAVFAIASTPLAGPALLTPPTLGQALTKNLLYAVIGALLILPGVFADRGGAYSRVLGWRPLRHVGHISYSIFCVHLIVLELFMTWREYELFQGHGAEIFVATALISGVVAEVLYRVVERPFMRLRTMPSRRRPAATTPARDSAVKY